MLELGAYEVAGHEQVGKHAAAVADLLVAKGTRARQIAEAARAAGMTNDQVVITYSPGALHAPCSNTWGRAMSC